MKKTTRSAIVLLSVLASLPAASFALNPVIQTMFTADPAPVVHDGTFYLFSSHDEEAGENGLIRHPMTVKALGERTLGTKTAARPTKRLPPTCSPAAPATLGSPFAPASTSPTCITTATKGSSPCAPA
ncbi:MAG: hypothetical protein ABIT76_05645 [Chthoniobacterales bacterium]